MFKIKYTIPVVFVFLLLMGCENPSGPEGPNNYIEFNSFSFLKDINTTFIRDCIAEINGDSVFIQVPYGTDRTALIASFQTTADLVSVNGVSQESGITANDFSGTVAYRLEKDGKIRNISVQIQIMPPVEQDKAILNSDLFSEAFPVYVGGTQVFNMVNAAWGYYGNERYPNGLNDSGTSLVTVNFAVSETEATNAIVYEVLQWALKQGRFVTDSVVNHPNLLNSSWVKQYNQSLLDLQSPDCRIGYNSIDGFSIEPGYENHPVSNITFAGAIMMCNWLTEMRDGHTDNVVYTDINEREWYIDRTTSNDHSRNGFRLPSHKEWEYVARISSSDTGNAVPGYSDPFYTKGSSVSGSVEHYDNSDAQNFAVFQWTHNLNINNLRPNGTREVKSLGSNSANSMGLYDMSGNVAEWCFSPGVFDTDKWITAGGGWNDQAYRVAVSSYWEEYHLYSSSSLGLRLFQTKTGE